jgi:hypothetical protein
MFLNGNDRGGGAAQGDRAAGHLIGLGPPQRLTGADRSWLGMRGFPDTHTAVLQQGDGSYQGVHHRRGWTMLRGSELSLYYVLSTWNPYVVVVIKSGE